MFPRINGKQILLDFSIILFEATNMRLDAVVEKFPSCSDYVNKYLRNTIYYWAKFSCTWRLRFGLKASSIQEAVHASIKKWLKFKSLLPHQLPIYLRRWQKGRMQRLQLKHLINDRNFIAIMRQWLVTFGLNDVMTDLNATMLQEGEHLMLTEMKNSVSLSPSIIAERDVLEKLVQDEVTRWGPEARRFQILYENVLREAGEEATSSNTLDAELVFL
jgi:hypothetical protein